jgi:cytochrome c oxidase assembly protein subunit 11
MNQSRPNAQMFGKLVFVAAAMFAFGYALVPIYKTICEMTGVNILALG